MKKGNKHLLIIESDGKSKDLIKNKKIKILSESKLDFDKENTQSIFDRLYRIVYKKSPKQFTLSNKLEVFLLEPEKDLSYNKTFINDIFVEIPQVFIDFHCKLVKEKYNFIFTLNNKDYKILLEILFNNSENQKKLSSDKIIGMKSWPSITSLFKFLNKHCNWMTIRNHEFLSDDYIFKKGDDIDILCDNHQYFIGMMNAKKRVGGRCSYEVFVKNQKIPLDIRYIGDKYFDPIWAIDMLNKKSIVNYIPIQSSENYFYSLLYHVKLQKFEIKEEYVNRLYFLSKELGLTLEKDFIYNDIICANILNGYLFSKNYKYTYTDDARRNEFFLKLIRFKELNDLICNWRFLLKRTPKVILNKVLLKLQNVFQ